jgi:DNA polymerase III subunit gamma/tau
MSRTLSSAAGAVSVGGAGRLNRRVSEQPEQQRSLYRRHRPRTFAEVVGQESVVRTLRNAVAQSKVHHAYLFVGSRGTGKTSMAKILAACLNCERGPTIEPCGECESCKRIMAATSLDVIEMDAASNNSVEDIRELRESVAYAPVSGRKKVYILDEAHMLSSAAWNAFLKTLEEPPPNTVFVLATTEANKVPATVVDRCHRFDFQRPSIEQLAGVVLRVSAKESIEIPPEAAAAVARSATGSFRDALGTLEQLLTYSGSSIAHEDVLAVLGVADGQLLEEIVDAVSAGDAAAVLRAVATCAEQGRDASALTNDVETRTRELLIANTLGEIPAELRLTPDLDERLLSQAQRTRAATLVRLLELLGAAMEATRAGADPRTQLELALVKAAKPEVDPSRQALLARLERLEAGAGQGIGGEGLGRVEGALSAQPTPPPPPPSAGPEGAQASAKAQEQTPSAPMRTRTAEAAAPAAPNPPPAVQAPPAEPAPAAPSAPFAPPAPSAPPPPPADPAQAGSVESLQALWPSVVDAIMKPNALLAHVIAEARPVDLEGDELTVAFDAASPFMKKKAEDPDNRMVVAQALRELTGRRLRLSYELRELESSPGGGYTEEEWVARFIEELDAEELEGHPASATSASAASATPSEKG